MEPALHVDLLRASKRIDWRFSDDGAFNFWQHACA